MKIRKYVIGIMLFACVMGGGIVLSCNGSDSGSNGPSKLLLFGTETLYNGNLGGRVGADAKCAADANMPAGLSHVHALISVTADDCIANMPDNYNFPDNVPIVAPDGITVIADNWADLIDGDIDVALGTAGVLPNTKADLWWSGSGSNGTLSFDNCTVWTNGDGVSDGLAGYPTLVDLNWIAWSARSSSETLHLLGIAY